MFEYGQLMKSILISLITISLLALAVQCSNARNTGTNPSNETVEDIGQPATEEPTDPVNYGWLYEKFERGVTFYGSGNEPFWALEFNRGNYIQFTNLDGWNITVPMTAPAIDTTFHSYTYAAESETGTLKVVLESNYCQDNMSGKAYAYSIEVTVRNKASDQEITVQGCGAYVPYFALNDIWMLYSINGEVLDKKTLAGHIPRLEFNFELGKILGNAGCNEYSAGFSEENALLSIGDVLSTKKACSQLVLEQKYVRLISGQTYTAIVTDGTLTLKNAQNTLVFKHTD